MRRRRGKQRKRWRTLWGLGELVKDRGVVFDLMVRIYGIRKAVVWWFGGWETTLDLMANL
jgi:hypothetical protein